MRVGYNNYKKQNKNNTIFLSVITIFSVICLISVLCIIKWYIDCMANKKIEEKIKEMVVVEHKQESINDQDEQKISEYKVDFEGLKQLNSKTVGWLKVNGTDIECAVVQANDNSYYLTHNFEDKYNVAGWIFADYKNKLDGTDKNIVIYGHNMMDGSMFGSLTNVLKDTWYNNEENYIIEFITQNNEEKYQVISAYKIEPEDYYITTMFDENEFGNFLRTIVKRSIKDFNVEVTAEDRILTLSTCDNTYTQRIVLHAKKIQ